ncbi:hypothetical protein EDB19DRAFT_1915616 [Suillus lakei]|nr:hypothetical protein EDB19DRAFT_1915616 [Suillus lakei]
MHQANLGQGVQSPPPQPAAPAPSTPHMPPAYAQERLSSSNPYSRSPLQQPGTREHPPAVETLFTLCRTMDPSVPDARSVHFLIFPDVKEEYLPMVHTSLTCRSVTLSNSLYFAQAIADLVIFGLST